MKIMQQELAQKLAAVKSAIPTRPHKDILKGVLVKDNTLTAYNLDYGITATLDGRADECFILPSEAIQMIESLPAGDIEITKEANHILKIQAGNIVHRISSLPPDDYPELPIVDAEQQFEINANLFTEGIESVIYAVSLEDKKPIQQGVLFEACGNDTLNIVTCDGYRLAWYHAKLEGKFKFVILGESLQKFLKLKLEGRVTIIASKSHAIFSASGCAMTTRLLEGSFMDYKAVVPENNNFISIEKKLLLDCLHRANLCANDVKQNEQGKSCKSLSPIVFTLESGEDVLHVSIRNHLAQHSETLPLTKKIDSDLKIGFNVKYLTEAVQHCDSDVIDMYFGNNLSAVIIRDENILSMVLPINPKVFQGG